MKESSTVILYTITAIVSVLFCTCIGIDPVSTWGFWLCIGFFAAFTWFSIQVIVLPTRIRNWYEDNKITFQLKKYDFYVFVRHVFKRKTV